MGLLMPARVFGRTYTMDTLINPGTGRVAATPAPFFPKNSVRKPADPALKGMSTSLETQKPRTRVRVLPLKSSTTEGKRYKRRAAVEAEIKVLLSIPESSWAREARKLRNETLVFLIRRTHRTNDEVCGELLDVLRKRIVAYVRCAVLDKDRMAAEELVLNVEIKILESVLSQEPCRKRDHLEVSFMQVVARLAKDHVEKFKNNIMAFRGEFATELLDDDDEEVERPLESFPGDGPSPHETLLNLERGNRIHDMVQTACDAVKDPKNLEAVILHYALDVPITSKKRGIETLQRRFRAEPGKISYWMETALKQMREALGTTEGVPRQPKRKRKEPKNDKRRQKACSLLAEGPV
jgi:hypothetical protein